MRSPAHKARSLLWSLLAATTLLLACGPTAAPIGRDEATVGEAPPQRTLQIGFQAASEPSMLTEYGIGSGASGREHYFIFHAPLTVYDSTGALLARAAAKVPTIQDGDWKLLPSGGMEVTWKLRPDVVWHDGAPLTAGDFLLGFQVAMDPQVAAPPTELRNISEVQAPDARTLVVHWRARSPFGNVNGFDGIPALPRHILGDIYMAGDKVAFDNSSYWNTGWIGLGPYRLTRWERGSFIEAAAFDSYFLGRPKIDRVMIRYIGDMNALVANVLSGDVDVVLSGAQLDMAQTVAIRQGWDAARVGGLTIASPKGVRTVYLQFRDPTAPWVQDVRVRQALQHALDRDGFVETMLYGMSRRMDFFVPPDDPVHKLAEQRGLPRSPFDPARTQSLMAEAGWQRGTDGLLRNNAGVGFARIDMAVSSGEENLSEATLLAGMWSAVGLQSVPAPWSRTGGNVNEIRATHPGAVNFPWNFTNGAPGTLTTEQIGTPANRWVGGNYGGYVNPEYDRLYATLLNTLEAPQREETLLGILRVFAEAIPVIPLYLMLNASVVRAGIEGLGTVPAEQATSAWNVHLWENK